MWIFVRIGSSRQSIKSEKMSEGSFLWHHHIRPLLKVANSFLILLSFSWLVYNSYSGDSKGLAAVPGREVEFKQCLELSVEYTIALKCTRYTTTLLLKVNNLFCKLNITQLASWPFFFYYYYFLFIYLQVTYHSRGSSRKWI